MWSPRTVPPAADVLGCAATLLSIALLWPQVWLTCVRGRTAGLPLPSLWLSLALNISWLTFGLLHDDRLQVLANVLSAAGNLALTVTVLRAHPAQRDRRALARSLPGPLLLLAVFLFVLLAAVSGPVLPLVAVGGALAVALPQPVALLHDRAADVSGVSVSRWVMSAGASGCWLGYGLLHDAPVVWLASVPGVLGALVVLQALAFRRRSDVLPAPAALPAAPVQLPQPRREPVLAA
jgi:uncharacterized protein with PQ loop repeat